MVSSMALQYAANGWHVIPLHITTAGKCSCGHGTCKSPGKHPRTRNGLKDASNDPKQILSWWGDEKRNLGCFHGANIGIRTGTCSRLFVVDVDGPEAAQSFADLVSRCGIVPSTEVVLTGRVDHDGNRAGRHYYFRLDDGEPAPPNSQSVLGPHIDVRGEGGYVVAPPSLHATGRLYRWAEGEELRCRG
jgi:putative DNA primase/helicase